MHKPSILYIVIAGILWGTAVIFSKILGADGFGFTPLQMTAMRNLVAAIVLCIYVLIANPKRFSAPFKEKLFFFISGIFIFFTGAFYYTAISLTSPSTAVVLMYISPILVMAVSVIFMGERFTVTKGIAVSLAFLGCGLVTGIIGGMKFQLFGIVTGILSGICYAAYNVCAKIEMKRGNDAVTASLYCFRAAAVVGTIICDPVSLIATARATFPAAVPYIIAQGIVTCALPYFLYTLASKRLTAGIAAALSSIEPMTATIISVALYNERLGVQGVLGIMFILAMVLLLSKSEEKQ